MHQETQHNTPVSANSHSFDRLSPCTCPCTFEATRCTNVFKTNVLKPTEYFPSFQSKHGRRLSEWPLSECLRRESPRFLPVEGGARAQRMIRLSSPLAPPLVLISQGCLLQVIGPATTASRLSDH